MDTTGAKEKGEKNDDKSNSSGFPSDDEPGQPDFSQPNQKGSDS